MLKQAETYFDKEHLLVLPSDAAVERAPRKPKPPFKGGIGPEVLITTDNGPIRAGDIRRGMRVKTLESGMQKVIWAGVERRLHCGYGYPAPVALSPRGLGGSQDAGSVVVAPGQNVLLRHRMNEMFFAARELLAPASELSALPGVQRLHGQYAAQWVHLLFDDLALVDAGSYWLESLEPDMPALRARLPQMAQAIEEAAPGLRFECGQAAYTRRHMVLNRKEVQMLEPQGYLA